MIKVVHISTSTMGGAGIAAYRLHRGLLKSGVCNSIFVCQNPGPYKNDPDVVEVKARPLKLSKRILKKIGSYLGKPKDFWNELSQIKGEYEIVTWPETNFRIELEKEVLNADVVHLHWVGGFLNYPTFFKKLQGKKIVWTLHDLNPLMGIFHYKGDQERNTALKHLDLKALKIKSASLKKSSLNIVAMTDWIAQEANKSPVFKEYHFEYIANGINCDVFHPLEKKLIREQLDIPVNECVMLFVSEHIDNFRKGMDILIDALALVTSSVPFRIISVGKGKLSLPENIKYYSLGSISDEKKLAQIYSCADIFVIPSREDNLPNVMVEAFACGTPVIGFPVGGMKQHIVPLKTGILADEESVVAFAKAIEAFLGDSDRFNRTTISAYAQENFNDKTQANSHVNMYKKLLNKTV
jgi:glycosyltransferase involved in cell wall biosynthesis